MATDKNVTAGWILNSIWLDLAYDEENESLVRNVKTKGIWLDPVHDEKGKSPLETNKNGRYFLPLKLTPREVHIPQREGLLKPDYWFVVFMKLKGIRIRDGLAFDEARCKFADEGKAEYLRSKASENPKLLREVFEKLALKAKERTRNLDAIVWRCGAALDLLSAEYDEAAKAEDSEQMKMWATLMALFHSEVCASATHDISFGMAKRFNVIVEEDAAFRDFFRVIAEHNVARGLNHLNKWLDATKTLDRLVDDFKNKSLLKEALSKLLHEQPDLEAKVEKEGLLDRIIYFPAIRTLAQAYGDLNRHAEQRFYLCAGWRYANGKKRTLGYDLTP